MFSPAQQHSFCSKQEKNCGKLASPRMRATATLRAMFRSSQALYTPVASDGGYCSVTVEFCLNKGNALKRGGVVVVVGGGR